MKYFIIAVVILVIFIAIIFITGSLLPQKHTAKVSTKIRASKEKIWAMISNPEAFASWRENVENVELLSAPGEPLRWKETYKKDDAITFQEIDRVELETFVSKIADEQLPFGGTWTISLVEEGESTVISITEDGEIYNVIFRVFARFVFGYDSTMKDYIAYLENASQ